MERWWTATTTHVQTCLGRLSVRTKCSVNRAVQTSNLSFLPDTLRFFFSFRFFWNAPSPCARGHHGTKAEPEAVRQIASSPRWTYWLWTDGTRRRNWIPALVAVPSRAGWLARPASAGDAAASARRAGGIGKQPWTTVTDARRSMSMISLLLSSARTCKIILLHAIGPVPSVRSCYS